MSYAKFYCKGPDALRNGYPQEFFVMHGDPPVFTVSTSDYTSLPEVFSSKSQAVAPNSVFQRV
jgi:hypothetical protein